MIRFLVRHLKLFSSPGKEFYLFLHSLLGFYPSNLHLYETAVIHKSASKVDSQKNVVNNERLEYLGDAILGAVVAEFLYNRFPGEAEGFLTQMRSKLVNRGFLTELTYQIGLNRFIKSNTNNTLESSHIFGDALEALIGALYIDKGYSVTRGFIVRRLLLQRVDLKLVEESNTNYKSQLIEWSQKFKKEINFETNEQHEGGKHPTFVTTISVNGQKAGVGRGSSKKEAQQEASRVVMENIRAASVQDTTA